MHPRVVDKRQDPRQTNFQQDRLLDKKSLQVQISNIKNQIALTDDRLNNYRKQYQKMIDSNSRNLKRLNRYKTKFQQMLNHRNQPQYFLHICGFMSQYMQQFMLAHDVQIMNLNQQHNPDNMTYQQLLELGQTIGKVSKGISKQQYQSLTRKKFIAYEYNCPICCTQFNHEQIAVVLNCKHIYHEQCIGQWLKDQNTCPICKKSIHDK